MNGKRIGGEGATVGSLGFEGFVDRFFKVSAGSGKPWNKG
jgi:hypothetical protein